MHVLIIADIEGSSGCFSRAAAASMTFEWLRACHDMTSDVAAVVRGLQNEGIDRITIHDFHRTGYNIIPQKIPSGCRIVSGYKAEPVPGVGNPGDADLLMMIGMHAPSGSQGFLAHTLTSRLASLTINGQLLSEAQLFSASLFSYNVRPVFFSGCQIACSQAASHIQGISTYCIDKSKGAKKFDRLRWRKGLANAAKKSLLNSNVHPYRLKGPFAVRMVLRDGPPAAFKLARRWNIDRKGGALYFYCDTFDELYNRLLNICYLTPVLTKYRSKALWLYSLWGRLGLYWVRTFTTLNGNN